MANARQIGLGFGDLVTAALPKAGSATGLNYEQSAEYPPTGTMLDGGGINHDYAVGKEGGFWQSANHFQWIADVTTGPGTPPGPFGLGITAFGIAVFGLGGALLRSVGR